MDELQNIMLSEGSQTQMVTYCMIPLKRNAQKRYIYRDRKQVSVCPGQSLGVQMVTGTC